MKKTLFVLIAMIIGGRCFAQNKLYPNKFSLGDLVLLDGPFKLARDLNIEVLQKYDVDILLAPYRKEAAL